MKEQSKSKKRVAVFGIFDGVHDGHRDFFRQARKHGDELVVIVGRDVASKILKNKTPSHSEKERLELVARESGVDKAVLGDKKQSSYKVLRELNPSVICLGYDQEKLQEDIHQWLKKHNLKIPMFYLKPYRQDVFHTSLLKRDIF